jgi:hypothetical protein
MHIGSQPPFANQQSNKGRSEKSSVKIKTAKKFKYCRGYAGQFPITPFNDSRHSAFAVNLHISRPRTSLIGSDISGSPSKSKEKWDINAFCREQLKLRKVGSKRNTLGIAESQLKMRRNSGTSHSNSKWNNKSMEDDANIIKFMMENRKKYNLSCGDIIDNKPNSKSKGKESKGCKKKAAVTANKKNNKTESKKAMKKVIVDNDGKRYKQTCLASKSKGSTSVANINLNATKQRKKGKENKENRKKKSRSRSRSKSKHQQKHDKSSKMFVLPKEDSDG